MTYEDFCTAYELKAFHDVKWRSMHLARIQREEAAKIVAGYVGDPAGGRKQFVITPQGVFRFSGGKRDNSTELAALVRQEVEIVKTDDVQEMLSWFERHGFRFPKTIMREWELRVRVRMARGK